MATTIGLTKQKKIDIKDTNMAFYGSENHKKLRKFAAMTDVNWKGAGAKVKPGLEIWRVENNQGGKCPFGIRKWPVAKYGQFFDGDSYICLKSFKRGKSPKIHHEIFFWLGSESSIDEKGVAAYKTVELDDFLGGAARQHRMVMNHESERFLSLFTAAITIMHGGVASGFKHVVSNAAKSGKGKKAILRKIEKRGRRYKIVVLPSLVSSLGEDDVYLLDCLTKVYQYNGLRSSGMEKNRAKEEVMKLKKKRYKKGGVVVRHEHVHRGDGSKFWTILGGNGVSPPAAPLAASNETVKKAAAPPAAPAEESDEEEGGLLMEEEDEKGAVLFGEFAGGFTSAPIRISSVTFQGDMPKFTTVKEGKEGDFQISMLKSDNFYVIDSAMIDGDTVWCWAGAKSDKEVRTEAMLMMEMYLASSKFPNCPVTLLKEGDDHMPTGFAKVFGDFGQAFDNSEGCCW